MTDPKGLIERHQANGLLIDTNLFLLFLVGVTNEDRIAKFPRTSQFSKKDFHLLVRVVRRFQTIVTTPHVLAEVSNLAKLLAPELQTLRRQFSAILEKTDEIYIEGKLLMRDTAFMKLGVTDAAIVSAASRKMLVLTDDFDLYSTLLSRGIDAVNFSHIRSL